MWGIVQCAALEMNSRLSLMVCIDTEALVMGGERLRPGFAVIGAAIPVSDFAGMVTAILSDVNPEETSALSWGGQDVWSYILWRR